MKILVTGCCGFIGNHLTLALLERGDEIFGVDLITDYYDIKIKLNKLDNLLKFKNFSFIKEDIVSTKSIQSFKPDIVVNLAAEVGIRSSFRNTDKYINTNILGFKNVMYESKISGVKKVIYASSSSVYGETGKVPFSESDNLENIISPYAFTKLSNEIWAKMCWNVFGQKSIGLRFFTVYGPGGRPDMAPYKIMNSILFDKTFEKYGFGDSSRDYTYIDDIINGIISAIDDVDCECEVFNLGGTKATSLNQFIEICEKITNKKLDIIQVEKQIGDVPITLADISKAKSKLNWSPKTNLVDGLTQLYLSMKK